MIIDGGAENDFISTDRRFAEETLLVIHQVMSDAGFARPMSVE